MKTIQSIKKSHIKVYHSYTADELSGGQFDTGHQKS